MSNRSFIIFSKNRQRKEENRGRLRLNNKNEPSEIHLRVKNVVMTKRPSESRRSALRAVDVCALEHLRSGEKNRWLSRVMSKCCPAVAALPAARQPQSRGLQMSILNNVQENYLASARWVIIHPSEITISKHADTRHWFGLGQINFSSSDTHPSPCS